ncbi:MAG: prolyl oligopeptidase family serine peptidase [Acidobacteriota bacterium]
MLSNESGADFELWRTLCSAVERKHWQAVALPEGVSPERLVARSDHLVLFGRYGGLRRVWVLSTGTRDTRTRETGTRNTGTREPGVSGTAPEQDAWRRVELPEEVSIVHAEDHREYQAASYRLGYSSLTTPYSVLELDLATRRLEVVKATRVLGGFRSADYGSQRLMARAPDGTEIPISLVFHKQKRRAGGNPLVLTAYGAYGYSLEPEFDAARLCLLDRGVVFAIAHVRGGGELGHSWHERGRAMRKQHTFTDFVACAEHLIDLGITRPEQLGILGESAGGLLVAAVINARPDLFAAAVADCPFVDVLSALRDPELPLTASDWLELGDPRQPDERAYITSYSPLENVEPRAYPAVYATAGLQDPRVPYWGPVKWVARLRECTTSDRPIVLEVDHEAGHWGASSRFDYFEETARKYAFLLRWLAA